MSLTESRTGNVPEGSFPRADSRLEEMPDADLVGRAKAGEMGAFDVLVERHAGRIFGLARRITTNDHDAEDVVQQAFMSAVEGLHTFREEAGFGTWVSRIATHAALKVLRKRNGLPTISLEESTEPTEADGRVPHPEYIADWRDSPERLVENNETWRLIEEALEALEAGYRVVFVLRDIEGLSVRETAELLGISEANVKVRLLRARLQLRERLTRSFGDPETRVRRSGHGH